MASSRATAFVGVLLIGAATLSGCLDRGGNPGSPGLDIPAVHVGDVYEFEWSPSMGAPWEAVRLEVLALDASAPGSPMPGHVALEGQVAQFRSDGNWSGYQGNLPQATPKTIAIDLASSEPVRVAMGAATRSGAQDEFPAPGWLTLSGFFPFLHLPLTGMNVGPADRIEVEQFGITFEARLLHDGTGIRFAAPFVLHWVGDVPERIPMDEVFEFRFDGNGGMPTSILQYNALPSGERFGVQEVFVMKAHHPGEGAAIAFGDGPNRFLQDRLPAVEWRDRIPEGAPIAGLSHSKASQHVEETPEWQGFAQQGRHLQVFAEYIWRGEAGILGSQEWTLRYQNDAGRTLRATVSATSLVIIPDDPVTELTTVVGPRSVGDADPAILFDMTPDLVPMSDLVERAAQYLGGDRTLVGIETYFGIGPGEILSAEDPTWHESSKFFVALLLEPTTGGSGAHRIIMAPTTGWILSVQSPMGF